MSDKIIILDFFEKRKMLPQKILFSAKNIVKILDKTHVTCYNTSKKHFT